MAEFIPAAGISEVWVAAANMLLSAKEHRLSNLIVEVDSSIPENFAVRGLVNALLAKTEGREDVIEAVADTIFPWDLYDPNESDSSAELFKRWEITNRIARQVVPKGDYFQRMCAYPLDGYKKGGGHVNQLSRVADQLRKAHHEYKNQENNGNHYEIGISFGSDELCIYKPGVDNCKMGFPCLSHLSVTLIDGRLDLTATYRAQDLDAKAYGNYVGLLRVIDFLANESGFEKGNLICVATCAKFDGSITPIKTLVSDCLAALKGE